MGSYTLGLSFHVHFTEIIGGCILIHAGFFPFPLSGTLIYKLQPFVLS